MFWGLIMEPNKRYTQTVERAFHVSMATLDIATADDDVVQVMLCYDGRNYLLCNLKKGAPCQTPLDLNFKEGTKIAFTSNGRGNVHLTGYLLPEDLDEFDEMEEEEEEEEVEEEEDEDEEVPQLIGTQSKRKAKASPTDQTSTKRMKALSSSAEEEEDSSDNENPEEDEDTEEDEGDDEEEGEEDDEEDEEVEEKPAPQSKKNKQKQQQQQKQQQNQKNQKQEKQHNLTNGKEAKVKGNKAEQPSPNDSQVQQKKRVIAGGVLVEDLKIGNGVPAKQGKFISVYYVGRLKNGKKFDSTTSGDGFKFRLGKGEVIKGWDVGVQGMKVGGKRRITIPPAMAYGAKGSPPVIPGNSTLTFEVELRNVH